MELYNSEDFQRSIENLNNALQSGDLNDNEIYSAQVTVGSCLNHIGKYDEAIEVLESVLDCVNDESEKYSELYHELSAAYYFKRNYEIALQFVEKSLECDSNNLIPYLTKGRILYWLERYDDAEIVLDTFLQYAPSTYHELIYIANKFLLLANLQQQFTTGEALIDDGKYEDAINVFYSIIDYLNSILDSIDSNSVHNNKTINDYLMISGDFQSASYMKIGYCYLELDNVLEALKYYAEAEKHSFTEKEKDKNCMLKHIDLFYHCTHHKDYEAAMNVANQVPKTNDLLISFRKYLTGQADFYLERYNEALECLLPCIDTDWPKSIFGNNAIRGRTYTYVGGAYCKLNKYETALKYLNKCIEINFIHFSDTWLFMGECYIALGEYEKALEELHKAVDFWHEFGYHDLEYLESRIKFAEEMLKDSNYDKAESNICPNCKAKIDSMIITAGNVELN